MEYRFLTDDEIEGLFNPACRAQGFAEMNINADPQRPTCRVLGAFWDGVLVEGFALQLYPVLGPILKVNEAFADNGDTSRGLAAHMQEFLEEGKARGYLTIADSPITYRLCKRFGMEEIKSPVFNYVRKES